MNNRKTALYRHYDADNNLLYIGISLSAMSRLSEHKTHSKWAYLSVRMETEWFDKRGDAVRAEKIAIIDENPEYNISHNKRHGRNEDGYLSSILICKSVYGDDIYMYFEGMKRFSSTMNKQTKFLFYSMFKASYCKKNKANVIDMTPRTKRIILRSMGLKFPISRADGYIKKIVSSGILKKLDDKEKLNPYIFTRQ